MLCIQSAADVPAIHRPAFDACTTLTALRSFKHQALGGRADELAARDSAGSDGRNFLAADGALINCHTRNDAPPRTSSLTRSGQWTVV